MNEVYFVKPAWPVAKEGINTTVVGDLTIPVSPTGHPDEKQPTRSFRIQ